MKSRVSRHILSLAFRRLQLQHASSKIKSIDAEFSVNLQSVSARKALQKPPLQRFCTRQFVRLFLTVFLGVKTKISFPIALHPQKFVKLTGNSYRCCKDAEILISARYSYLGVLDILHDQSISLSGDSQSLYISKTNL